MQNVQRACQSFRCALGRLPEQGTWGPVRAVVTVHSCFRQLKPDVLPCWVMCRRAGEILRKQQYFSIVHDTPARSVPYPECCIASMHFSVACSFLSGQQSLIVALKRSKSIVQSQWMLESRLPAEFDLHVTTNKPLHLIANETCTLFPRKRASCKSWRINCAADS